jgi:hypothetical protein
VGHHGGWAAARAWFERQLKTGCYRIGPVNYIVSGATFEPGPDDAETSAGADLPTDAFVRDALMVESGKDAQRARHG